MRIVKSSESDLCVVDGSIDGAGGLKDRSPFKEGGM